MNDIPFKRLKQIVVLFFDEKDNYNTQAVQAKLGSNLFKEKHLITNKNELEEVLKNYDDNQKFITLVHISSSKLNIGIDNYNNSGIPYHYPNVRYYFISSSHRKDLTVAENIVVYNYSNFRAEIDNSILPQSKKEILNGSTKQDTENKRKGIFLSHSSADKDIVIKFRDLILDNGLKCEIDIENIMLTSDEANAIKEKRNIPNEIMNFLLNKTGLFIQFISEDYTKSRVCLNEEGAGWVLFEENNFISLILPDTSFSESTWLMTVDKGSKINNKNSLFNIYENRKDFFPNINISHLNNKIDEFLNWLEDYKKDA